MKVLIITLFVITILHIIIPMLGILAGMVYEVQQGETFYSWELPVFIQVMQKSYILTWGAGSALGLVILVTIWFEIEKG